MDKHVVRGREAYQKRMQYLAEHKGLCRLLHVTNQVLTGSVFLMYPALLIWLYINDSQKLVSAVLVPLDAFVIVSVSRLLIGRKRPYEAYETPSAVHKSTKGKSFPSRHVFSIYMIAMTYLFLAPTPLWGILLLVMGVALAAIRVVIGVHYTSDVIVGAIVGIVAAVIGFGMVF